MGLHTTGRTMRVKQLIACPCHLLVLILSILGNARQGHSAAGKGLEKGPAAAVLFQVNDDPQGDRDSFGALSDREQKRWGYVEDAGVDAKIRYLTSLETTVSVEIKLVGFDGDGNAGVSIHDGDMHKFLEALKSDPRVQVIHGETHELGFSTKQIVHLTRAPHPLIFDIEAALGQALKKAGKEEPKGSGPIAVPHVEVDKLVQADYKKDQGGYTVYILNPKKQDRPYAYTYGDAKDCLGTLFAGKERYVWVDLTAGPVGYGPLEHGEGLVTNTTFVRPAAYARDQLRGAFLAHLVSLVASATEFLLSPAMFHHPVPYAQQTEVRLVHLKGAQEDSQEEGIDLAAIEAEMLGRGGGEKLVLPGQGLSFQTSNLLLSHCAFCVAAYSRALRSYPGPALQEDGRLAIHQYLDSEELHHLLSEFWPEIKTAAGAEEPAFMHHGVASSGRVIPVFVLELDTEEPILLDRTDQAVAYNDMVIAVRTKKRSHPLNYQCRGEVVMADLRDVTRPVLGALLQTGWGVTPQFMTWSSLHNRTVEDYRWSVGPTPFGPFSQQRSLSFAQRDAALRNILLTLLNDTISDGLHTLSAMKGYGGEEIVLRAGRRRAEYMQRWNVLKHKLSKACAAISLLNYNHALYFLRSAQHELAILFDIARTSAMEVNTTFSCYKDPPTNWLWYASLVALCFGVGSLWMNRDRIFKVKHKSF